MAKKANLWERKVTMTLSNRFSYLWEIYGKFMGNLWEIYGKFMRKEGDNDSQQTPIHGYFQIEYKQVL